MRKGQSMQASSTLFSVFRSISCNDTLRSVPRKQAVKPIPPTKPEARDEGPRLIPLEDEDEKMQHAEKLRHYMRLADLALAHPADNKE